MNKRERRFLQTEVSIDGSDNPKITGYAAVFDMPSHDLGGFVEVIDAHAFDECLASSPDIMGLYNHSADKILGRTTSGTLRVSVDSKGLKYEIDPPNTTYAKDLMESMGRKDVTGSSFGFYCLKDEWTVNSKTKQNVRRILKANVFDVSPVTEPAYPDASSQLRSLFPDDKGGLPEEFTNKIAELRGQMRRQRNLRSIMSAVTGTKWAITQDKLETIIGVLNARAAGDVATKEEIQAALMGQEVAGESATSQGVMVLPMYGTIGQRMTMMTEFSGGFSCEGFTRQFRAALADDNVSAIVFDIDSPGGSVTGVPELAAEILASRGKKPIVAVSNGMAGSAAYWLASAADKIVCIPSGEVGSIGVFTVHKDYSGALEHAGIAVTYIQAGKYKTEGNPYSAPSDDFLENQQKDVDAFYEMFVSAVAAGRGLSVDKVKSDFGQGRMLMAKDALQAGMIDEIATLDEIVSGYVGSPVTVVTDPDSMPLAEGTSDPIQAEMQDTCQCDCQECADGDCVNCSNDDCDDPICDCGDDDTVDDDGSASTEAEQNERAKCLVKIMEMSVE